MPRSRRFQRMPDTCLLVSAVRTSPSMRAAKIPNRRLEREHSFREIPLHLRDDFFRRGTCFERMRVWKQIALLFRGNFFKARAIKIRHRILKKRRNLAVAKPFRYGHARHPSVLYAIGHSPCQSYDRERSGKVVCSRLKSSVSAEQRTPRLKPKRRMNDILFRKQDGDAAESHSPFNGDISICRKILRRPPP